jgi:hypothetical protein
MPADPTDNGRHPLEEHNELAIPINPKLLIFPELEDLEEFPLGLLMQVHSEYPNSCKFSFTGTATQKIWELFSDLNVSNASLILEEYCRIKSSKPITFENIQITREIFMSDSKIESDIELVMSQTNASKKDACRALIEYKGDVVDAIIKLSQ